MKSRWRYVVVVSILVVGLALALGWLLGTSSGARFLIEAISQWSPVEIHAEKIDGRIIDNLTLHQTVLKSAQVEVLVDRLLIRWQSAYLLSGTITFEKLDMNQVNIQDGRPEGKESPQLALPKIHGLLAMIGIEIQSFHVHRLAYHRMNRPILTLDNLFTRVSWDQGILRVKQFRLDAPMGWAEGKAEVSFLKSALLLDLLLSPKEPVIGLDQLKVNLEMQPGKVPGEISGPLTLTGKSASKDRISLAGNLNATVDGVRFNHFRLSRPGQVGEVIFEGGVKLSTTEPLINLRVNLKDLDLSKEFSVAHRLTGELSLEGHPSTYRGLFALQNSGPSWQTAHLSGSFEGNLSRLKISNLNGSWLDGTLKGHIEMTRTQDISFSGVLQASNLDPSRITPEWEGRINLNARGNLHLPEDKRLSGSLKIHLLESRLHGKVLTGNLEAEIRKGRVTLSSAQFRGKGFDLSAHGDLEERLNFTARMSDLASLIPGARGSFFVKGWARWQDHQPAGFLSGQGQNVSLGKIKMSHLEVVARLDEGEKGAVVVKANVQKLVYGSMLIDSLLMDATGAFDDHKVEMALHWPEGEMKASLNGTYDKETWQGWVTHLSGKGPHQIFWSLHSPFPVALAHNKLHFGPMEIGTRTGQKVQILTDLSFRPIRGFVEASWKRLNLGFIPLYLGKPHLSGHATGQLKAHWMEDDRLRVAASMEATGIFQNDSIKLEASQASLDFRWNEKGLQGTWKMVLEKEGQVDGEITSSEPARLNLPEQAAIKANWKAIDLSFLKAWLPRDFSLEGQCSGRLSGNWIKPGLLETEGEMKVSQGMMRWRNREAMLTSTLRAANLDWSWRNTLRGKMSLVLSDYGNIKGRFELPLNARLPLTIQKTGPLEVSVQGQIQGNGLFATLFPSSIQASRGKIDLNLNTTGTWAKPRLEARVGVKEAGVEIRITPTPAKHKSIEDRDKQETFSVEVSHGSANLNWDEKGFSSSWEAILAHGGSIQGTLVSSQPARLAFPERGKFDIRWERIDLTLLHPWSPPPLVLEGQLSGHLDGQWFEGQRLAVNGKTAISQGFITWKEKDGSLRTELRNAEINLDWKGETLAGEISIALEKFGQGRGKFFLPLSARFPPAIHPDGTVHLSLEGQVREKGVLTTFFPDLVQESQGEVDLKLKVEGTWRKPSAQGRFTLSKARAYLPQAGVHLTDVEAEGLFTGEQIRLLSFRVRSGSGHIGGTATFWMKGWRISRYEGHVEGERFQTVYLPELRVLTSPRLKFEGTGERMTIKGEILVPEGEFLGLQTKGLVRPSPDVIIVGIHDKNALPSTSPFPLEASVRILLGEKVWLRAEGIDTRLVGSVTIGIRNGKELKANGEIQAVEGHYSYYGQKLVITRGRLLFDGPLENPGLDVLALRKIKRTSRWEEQLGELQAGVLVTGKLQSPVIRLYSEPSMADADILSYLILGQPATTSRTEEQTNLLGRAAGALLSAGGSTLSQSQIFKALRIDTLDIQSEEGDISRSLVTIGKYLDPRLYVGLGGSLFTNTYQIILRYSLTKNIEIEAKTGTQSGANIYFKVEFE